MTDDRIEPGNWRPQLIDDLDVSLTNAAAFSPPTPGRSRLATSLIACRRLSRW
jgi:hypothetical protein